MIIDSKEKHTSFSPSNDVVPVNRIEGIWYTQREFEMIRKRDHEILKKIRRAEFKEGVCDSARGLSRTIDLRGTKPVVRVVLQEQKRQQAEGISDVSKLAEFSFQCSKDDRAVALEKAFKDAVEASQTRPCALPQLSTFKLILAYEKRPQPRSKLVKQESFAAISRRDTRSPRSDTTFGKPRKISKAPSLRKAFSKALSERILETEDIYPGNERHYKLTSVSMSFSKRHVIDRDETTELTVASYSSSGYLCE